MSPIGEVTGEYDYDPAEEWAQRRAVKWLAVFDPSLPAEQIFEKAISQMTLYEASLKLDRLEDLISPKRPTAPEPCVLIIDEINRANVAKVLGDLITLLEPDKRLGAKNEKRVILPYSRDEFRVPPNLYILGTMNTADRSIASLDIALRRRFEFVEVAPDENLVDERVGEIDGVRPSQVMRAINRRISFLMDRDHRLGHAEFLRLASLDGLAALFRRRILPLLDEYFHGDFEKIAAALGCPVDEEGNSSADHPIIKASLEEPEALFGAEVDLDERLRFEVNPDFLTARGADLRPFFETVIGDLG